MSFWNRFNLQPACSLYLAERLMICGTVPSSAISPSMDLKYCKTHHDVLQGLTVRALSWQTVSHWGTSAGAVL